MNNKQTYKKIVKETGRVFNKLEDKRIAGDPIKEQLSCGCPKVDENSMCINQLHLKEEPKTCTCHCHIEKLGESVSVLCKCIKNCIHCHPENFEPQQPSEWEERFENEFNPNHTKFLNSIYSGIIPFIRQLLSDAKEEERTRLVEEIEKCIFYRDAEDTIMHTKSWEKLKERV